MPKFDANEMLNGLFAQSFPQTPSGGAPVVAPAGSASMDVQTQNPAPTPMDVTEDAQVPANTPQATQISQEGNPENGFNTPLTPDEEVQFQKWKAQNAPNDSGEDYDLRGSFKAGSTKDPITGHGTDKFKKPNHPTFSDESQYAKFAPEKAGHWKDGKLVMPNGSIKADETPNAADQWEKEWKEQYNVSAKDLVGEDTYSKLRMLADEKLSHAQILGLMAVVATNPEAGWKLINAKEERKNEAIKVLADLEKTAMIHRSSGLTQIAQTKREEAKTQAAQDKEDAKNRSAEYKQRVAASTDIMNDVTSKGLPEGTVQPPTQEELNDPDKFWKEWMPNATGGVAKFVGKQQILQQLTTRQASPWLNSLAVMDPKHGVENYLRGTKHFSEEEIAQLQASVIPGFTKAAQTFQQKGEAEVALTNAKAQQAAASVSKYAAQSRMLQEKLRTIGQMTPQQQAQLKLQAEKMKSDIRDKQAQWQYVADKYANVGKSATDQNWSSTVLSYTNGISDLQNQYDSIDEISQQIDAQASNRSMTVAEALPVSAEEAVQDTIRHYQGVFATPDELTSVIYSDQEPDTPQKREARNFFFMRLIVGIQGRAGGHPSDIYNQLDNTSNSLLDAYAKHNVTMPPLAGQMAAGVMQQAQ